MKPLGKPNRPAKQRYVYWPSKRRCKGLELCVLLTVLRMGGMVSTMPMIWHPYQQRYVWASREQIEQAYLYECEVNQRRDAQQRKKAA